MGVPNPNNTLSSGLVQRGTVLLLPVTLAKPRSIEYAYSDLKQLLLPGQYLVMEDFHLTLRQKRRVLAQAALRPLVFRVFLALLIALQQERSSPYAELLALKEATDDQVTMLLKCTKAGLVWLEEGTDMQRRLLQQQGANGRERVLKPLRKAIREPDGLGPVLFDRRFPWEVQNRYGRGYLLARLPYCVD